MTHLFKHTDFAPRPAVQPAVADVRAASAFPALPILAGITVLGLAEALELLGLLVLVLLGLILLLS